VDVDAFLFLPEFSANFCIAFLKPIKAVATLSALVELITPLTLAIAVFLLAVALGNIGAPDILIKIYILILQVSV
jgi:hypothetical protein